MNHDHTTTPASVEDRYSRIMASALFRIDGEDLDYPEEFSGLAQAVHEDPRSGEDLDGIGEFEVCDLWGLLVGAFWAFTECHGGQWSPEYAAFCAIGQVYSPGCGHAPTEGEPGWEVYNALCEALCPGSRAD